MFKNYAKITFRNFKRDKEYFFINVFGLALSIACFLLIILYINQELSYDKYHADNDRIFMISEQIKSSSDLQNFAKVGWPVAPALKDNFPQVEYTARVYTINKQVQIQNEDKMFYEPDFIYAENDLFNILSFDVLRGNPQKLLTQPNTIVLTDKKAKKYFGNKNPVGKNLKVDNADYIVTGVIKSLPPNTHLKFGFVASLKTIENPDWFSNWFGTECYTYIKIKNGVNMQQFQVQMTGIAHKYVDEQLKNFDEIYRYQMVPVSEIHWQTQYNDEPEAPGNFNNILLFGGIGIFILLIASINYTNLSTAQSMIRAKEVGLRKVIGAAKKQLILQFTGESLILVFIASLIGIVIVISVIPYFNHFTQTTLLQSGLLHPHIIFFLLILILVVGTLAGIYPALVISGFQPITVLHGKFYTGIKGKNLRRILVVFQFALAVLLIVGTIIISDQIGYMKNQDLGFEKSQKLVIPAIGGARLTEKYDAVKESMINIPGVQATTISSAIPGGYIDGYNIVLEGHKDEVNRNWDHLFIDPDFIPVYGLKLLAGRNFDYNISSDQGSFYKKETEFIINESAMKNCGWKSPQDALGAYLITGEGGRKGKIIGVIKNFHYEGLQNRIEPVVLEWLPQQFKMMTLNISTADISNTLHAVKEKWKQFFPNSLMKSFFLDSNFDRQYSKVEQTAKLTNLFTLIGIVIACFGLLGLISFIAGQKTKEIGIRKTLGASTANILKILLGEIFQWIIIGNCIGLPFAYLIMNRWLQNFAYHIEPSMWIFTLALGITLIIALSTVSFKSIQAALTNPVNSLRYE